VFFAPSNFFLAISSQSPSTAISRTRPSSLPTTVLYSLLLPATLLPCRTLHIITLYRPTENTVFCYVACLLVRYFGFPIDRLCCGNVFTDPLPSNGCTRHNINVTEYPPRGAPPHTLETTALRRGVPSDLYYEKLCISFTESIYAILKINMNFFGNHRRSI
jgi:hypothetical protein